MQLRQISSTFFVTVMNRLGIRPPFDEPFTLVNNIQPVSLVDTDIVLPVTTTDPVFGTPFSIGHTAAPAINTVLADTGPLAVGNWTFKVLIEVVDGSAAFSRVALQHRDAANAANVWEVNHYTIAGAPTLHREISFAKTIVLNERIRAINLVAGPAGSAYQATIFALQLS